MGEKTFLLKKTVLNIFKNWKKKKWEWLFKKGTIKWKGRLWVKVWIWTSSRKLHGPFFFDNNTINAAADYKEMLEKYLFTHSSLDEDILEFSSHKTVLLHITQNKYENSYPLVSDSVG